MTDHLDMDELEQALRYGLDENRALHLATCSGCQNSVEWKRHSRHGQLWDEDRDWACTALDALAHNSRINGRGMVYYSSGYFSKLAMLSFEATRIIKIPWPESGFKSFVADYEAWLTKKTAVMRGLEEQFPCQTAMCGYQVPMCANCALVQQLTEEKVGPSPNPKEYGR